MTSKSNGFLDQLINGVGNPKGTLGSWQHASRTFEDDYFRLAPKAKFLYHVFFDINTSALKTLNLKYQSQNELGLLVKGVDLPKFTLKTATLNQYNRKKVVTMDHDFQPINIKFHDDRAHLINTLWQNYYSYYFADPSSAQFAGAYSRNAMRSSDFIRNKYGLDNNSSIPFFNSITIYQLNNREYVSYTLVNPVITAFSHDQPQASDQGSAGAENNMTIAYEAVAYDIGYTASGAVKGFAVDHYDKMPSPLSAAGGGTSSLFGPGGVVSGVANTLSNIERGNIVGAAITAVNTYQNAKSLTNAGLQQEGNAILTAGAIAVAAAGLSGIKNIVFPSAGTGNTTTNATQIDF